MLLYTTQTRTESTLNAKKHACNQKGRAKLLHKVGAGSTRRERISPGNHVAAHVRISLVGDAHS